MLMPDEFNNPRRGTSPRKFRINIIPMCPQLLLSFRSGGGICFRRLPQPSKIIIKICPWSVNCTDRRPSSSGGCSNPLCTHFGPYGQIGKGRRQNIARCSVVSWHASEWRIAPSVPHLDVSFIYILFAALGAFWVGLYSLGSLADWLTDWLVVLTWPPPHRGQPTRGLGLGRTQSHNNRKVNRGANYAIFSFCQFKGTRDYKIIFVPSGGCVYGIFRLYAIL